MYRIKNFLAWLIIIPPLLGVVNVQATKTYKKKKNFQQTITLAPLNKSLEKALETGESLGLAMHLVSCDTQVKQSVIVPALPQMLKSSYDSVKTIAYDLLKDHALDLNAVVSEMLGDSALFQDWHAIVANVSIHKNFDLYNNNLGTKIAYVAARNGDFGVLKNVCEWNNEQKVHKFARLANQILPNPIDVNYGCNEGPSLIYAALSAQSPKKAKKCIKYLMDSYADTILLDSTIYENAIKNNKLGALKFLITNHPILMQGLLPKDINFPKNLYFAGDKAALFFTNMVSVPWLKLNYLYLADGDHLLHDRWYSMLHMIFAGSSRTYRSKVVADILSNPHINVNVVSEPRRYTPLHMACARWNLPPDFVRTILDCPRVALNAQANDGKTPFFMAIKHNNPKMMDFLLDYKHQDRTIDYNMPDTEGHIPLCAFFQTLCENAEKAEHGSNIVLKTFIEHPQVHINVRDNQGITPLVHMAKFISVYTDNLSKKLERGITSPVNYNYIDNTKVLLSALSTLMLRSQNYCYLAEKRSKRSAYDYLQDSWEKLALYADDSLQEQFTPIIDFLRHYDTVLRQKTTMLALRQQGRFVDTTIACCQKTE